MTAPDPHARLTRRQRAVIADIHLQPAAPPPVAEHVRHQRTQDEQPVGRRQRLARWAQRTFSAREQGGTT